MIGILLGSAESCNKRGLCSRWVRSIANQGLNVVAVKSGEDESYYQRMLDVLHGFLLPGGDTDVFCENYDYSVHKREPEFDLERDRAASIITRGCAEKGIPLLGICRGMQEMNVAMGGRLSGLNGHDHGYQYKEQRETEVHDIVIQTGGMFARLAPHMAKAQVNSIHRFGINKGELAPRLFAEALCPLDEVVEALSLPGHKFFLGVQFHAEFSSTNGLNEIIISRFGDAAKAYSQFAGASADMLGHEFQILRA